MYFVPDTLQVAKHCTVGEVCLPRGTEGTQAALCSDKDKSRTLWERVARNALGQLIAGRACRSGPQAHVGFWVQIQQREGVAGSGQRGERPLAGVPALGRGLSGCP